jgi:hypothetical protein
MEIVLKISAFQELKNVGKILNALLDLPALNVDYV